MGALRIVLGGSLLALLAVATRAPLARCFDPEVRLATLAGAVAVAAYQLSFFAAVTLSGVAVGTLVAIGSAPMLADLLVMLGGERPAWAWGVATALAIAGCALLLLPAGQSNVQPLGTLLALVAGASYAALTVTGRRVVLHTDSPDATMAVFFSTGALLIVPVLAFQDLHRLASLPGVAMIAWLGVVTTALAYWLFARGLARLSAATATTLDLAEPLTAALLGVFVLGERLRPQAAIGIVLITAGLLLLTILRPDRLSRADQQAEERAKMDKGWR